MALFGQTPVGLGALSSSIKVGKPIYDITIVGDLVASNQINITINGGTPIAVVYSNSTPYTMQLLKAALIAETYVDSAFYLGYNEANNTYKIRFTGTYQNTLTITGVSITGGASQPPIECVYVDGINEVPFEGGGMPTQRLTQRSHSSTTANKVYHGFALANSAEDIPVWYIYVVDSTTKTQPQTLFPDTGAAFDYKWDDRDDLNYI